MDWLIEKRERANYRDVRFGEPDCGTPLEYVVANTLRRTLNAYLSEVSLLYVFDPDHALLAYPLRVLQMIGNEVAAVGAISLSEDEKDFLRSRTKDQKGTLPMLISEMNRLNLLK